jgi:Holliday junction resolvase RusA-like endonuclease
MNLHFFVPGIPVPKGSTKAFVVKGRAVTTATNGTKEKPWASAISYSAMQEIKFSKPTADAISVSLTFYMPRPKGHYGTGRNSGTVKESAPLRHTNKPDLDKLVRSVCDSLTNVVWNDDSQVVTIKAEKKYERIDSGPGVAIWVTTHEM